MRKNISGPTQARANAMAGGCKNAGTRPASAWTRSRVSSVLERAAQTLQCLQLGDRLGQLGLRLGDLHIASVRLARASSAWRLASIAAASSMSAERIALSASTVTTCGCTSRMPPPVMEMSTFSPLASVTTTLPGLRRVISGAWRGVMPNSPSSPWQQPSSPRPSDLGFGTDIDADGVGHGWSSGCVRLGAGDSPAPLDQAAFLAPISSAFLIASSMPPTI
jgi:hypothetical protein